MTTKRKADAECAQSQDEAQLPQDLKRLRVSGSEVFAQPDFPRSLHPTVTISTRHPDALLAEQQAVQDHYRAMNALLHSCQEIRQSHMGHEPTTRQ